MALKPIYALGRSSHLPRLLANSLGCIALCAALVVAISGVPAQAAYAEDLDINPIPDEFQQEVERTAIAYDEAVVHADEAAAALEENAGRLAELEALIPEQQRRTEQAARDMYKMQNQSGGLIDLVLSAESFDDFVKQIDYVNRVAEANVEEITKLRDMKAELDNTQGQLEQAKADADEQTQAAADALEAAQAARMEAQRRAEEEARQRAEAEAAAAAAAAAAEEARRAEEEAARQEDEKDEGGEDESDDEDSKSKEAAGADEDESNSDEDAESDEDESTDEDEGDGDSDESVEQETTGSDENAEETAAASDEAAAEISDGADWSSDQQAFIEEWTRRIDAYLEGSELAGQGKNFAKAAWDYGVDPRWSPAISCTESGKGASCFLPHNAWGWGSASWDSWEEAIDEHVAGLARGYGYTISMENAQKYCPPNSQFWYDTTLGQMNLI